MIRPADQPVSLPIVNRDCVVLLPTEAYLAWARSCPNGDTGETLDQLRRDGNAYLIGESESVPDTFLRQNWRTLFDQELLNWCTDKAYWPRDRSYHTFRAFFDVQYCGLVFDLELDSLERE